MSQTFNLVALFRFPRLHNPFIAQPGTGEMKEVYQRLGSVIGEQFKLDGRLATDANGAWRIWGGELEDSIKRTLHLVNLASDFDMHIRAEMDKGPLQKFRGLVFQSLRKDLQDFQIGGTFQVQHPSGFFGLIVLIPPDTTEGFKYLAFLGVNCVWFTDKSHKLAFASRFVQHHLGMAGGYDLRALTLRSIHQ